MSLNVLSAAEDATANDQRWSSRGFVSLSIVLLAALASFAVFTTDPWSEPGNHLPANFQLNLQAHVTIDREQIRYQLSSQFDLPFEQVRAISTGPLDEIYVAGDRAVHIFTNKGDGRHVVELEVEPSCLAVGGAEHIEPGRLFVGATDGVHVFHAAGQEAGSWRVPKEQSVLTSIAVGENNVFVADVGNRVVWRFDTEGQLVGQIGASDPERRVHGFVTPGPYLDVVVGAADLVHITNPGKLQVATYTFDGDFGAAWGRAGSTLSGFFGCCNPCHLAMLPDGRFVTSEKGIPRIKVYSPHGKFEAVVAGPRQLGVDEHAVGDPRFSEDRSVFDIAVDSRGRVLVLDANRRKVLIFVPKDPAHATGDNA